MLEKFKDAGITEVMKKLIELLSRLNESSS
jgi:hypothetical protein